MAFRFPLNSSISSLFSGLAGKEKNELSKMKMEVEEYLRIDDYNEEFVRLLVISFNDTYSSSQESLCILKSFLSYIRNRLLQGKPHEYKRLIHLLDAFVRNCGIRAQILIGRKKFLQVISVTARKFKAMPMTACQECAAIALDCLQAWGEAFSEFKEVLPFYEETYLKLKNKYHLQFPRPAFDHTRVPIAIDVKLLTQKFPPHIYKEDLDEKGTTNNSGSEGEEEEENEEESSLNSRVHYTEVFELTDSFYGEVGMARV